MYRFQALTEFNQHKIDDRDKRIAKMNFHIFDRLLSMDNVCIPVTSASATKKADYKSRFDKKPQSEADKTDWKVVSKRNQDYAVSFTGELLSK